MEENNAIDRKSDYSAQEEQSFINFQAIYKTIVLNWYSSSLLNTLANLPSNKR